MFNLGTSLAILLKSSDTLSNSKGGNRVLFDPRRISVYFRRAFNSSFEPGYLIGCNECFARYEICSTNKYSRLSPSASCSRCLGNRHERPFRFLFFRGRVDREEEKKKEKKKKKIGHAFDGNSLTRERERGGASESITIRPEGEIESVWLDARRVARALLKIYLRIMCNWIIFLLSFSHL